MLRQAYKTFLLRHLSSCAALAYIVPTMVFAADTAPVAKQAQCTFAQAHPYPVYLLQSTFADGQALAVGQLANHQSLKMLDASNLKRVTFDTKPNTSCQFQNLAIAKGGDWGWHLVWMENNQADLQYARMDGEAWVSSPIKKLSQKAKPSTAPLIITSGQFVWVVWVETAAQGVHIEAAFSEDEGRSWFAAKRLATVPNAVTQLALNVQSNQPYLVGQGLPSAVPLLPW